jgi:hypothetical protein
MTKLVAIAAALGLLAATVPMQASAAERSAGPAKSAARTVTKAKTAKAKNRHLQVKRIDGRLRYAKTYGRGQLADKPAGAPQS